MAETSRPQLQLRILATTDLHAHILPWDDLANRSAPERGLAQVAPLVAQARAEVSGSLLLDNGDFLNGSPLADYVAETRKLTAQAPHPMIAALNQLGYDAATLGNHEFSNGLPYLKRALSHATFPVIASNVDRTAPSGRRPFLPRYVLVPRELTDQDGLVHKIVVGIIGVLPPQTALWERRHLEGKIAVRDILASVQNLLPKVRRAGAEVIVALSHSGLGTDTSIEGAENISFGLALLDGVDAVIAGHTHQVYPLPAGDQPYRDTGDATRKMAPIVMPGFLGSHLGVIDMTLAKADTGWQVVAHKASARPVSQRHGPHGEVSALVATDPGIAATAARDTKAMRQRAAQPVGETLTALHSFFSLVGQSSVDALLAAAQLENMATLLAQSPEAALPILVSVAPFKAGGRGGPANFIDIPPGRLTTCCITDLYTHPNSPAALRLTGQDVTDWLERSVSLFHQVPLGARDACLVDLNFPAFNFDMIHGLSYQIDLSAPPRFDAVGRVITPSARRIRELRFKGQPVLPDQPFVLVTNSYRASGGAGFAGASPANVVIEDRRSLRSVLQDFVTKHTPVSVQAQADWRFAAMPGTSVTFDTNPAALAHCAEVKGLTPLGPQPTGFMRFRLDL